MSSMEFGNNYLSLSQCNNRLDEIICLNNVVKCCQTEMEHNNTSVRCFFFEWKHHDVLVT